MTAEIADRYRRLSEAFAATIAAVPADRWEAQSPCPEWTARGVVDHMVGNHKLFLGFVGKELGDIPSVDDDPGAAFDAAHAKMQPELDDPDRANAEFDGGFGRTTLAAATDRFMCLDLVVHRWDLAHATGIDEHIDDDEIQLVRERAATLGDSMRRPGVMGPELQPPAGVDEQTKLLAYLGRDASS